MWICENGDIMRMFTCSVYKYVSKRIVFLYKVTSPSTGIPVSTYISAKLKKLTYTYDSLKFPIKLNTRGNTTFIPFHTKCDLQEQFWLFSHSYLQNGMLWLQNNFNIPARFKNWYFWTLLAHIQLHMYEFNSVSLLGSSRDTALHFGAWKAPVRIPSNYSSTKQLKSAYRS